MCLVYDRMRTRAAISCGKDCIPARCFGRPLLVRWNLLIILIKYSDVFCRRQLCQAETRTVRGTISNNKQLVQAIGMVLTGWVKEDFNLNALLKIQQRFTSRTWRRVNFSKNFVSPVLQIFQAWFCDTWSGQLVRVFVNLFSMFLGDCAWITEMQRSPRGCNFEWSKWL